MHSSNQDTTTSVKDGGTPKTTKPGYEGNQVMGKTWGKPL